MLCEVRRAKPRAVRVAGGRLQVGGERAGFAPRCQLALHQVEERQVALAQVGRFRRPIIHLDIDVGVIIGVPGRAVVVVPQPLQIGRQPAGTRAGDQQIAPVLEKQLLQSGVHRLRGGQFAPVGRLGQLRGSGASEVRRDAVEEALKILLLPGPKRAIALARRRLQGRRQPPMRVLAAVVFGIVHGIVRARGHQQGEIVAVRELQSGAARLERTALVQHPHLPFVFETVVKPARNDQPVAVHDSDPAVRIGQTRWRRRSGAVDRR